MDLGQPAPYMLAVGLGLVGGVVDLLVEEGWPDRYVYCVPAFLYILLNGLAGAAALIVANLVKATFFGLDAASQDANWIRAAVAGVSGVALIRASIGKHSDPTQSVVRFARWFEELMDIALCEVADRRSRANNAPAVAGIMRVVSFERARILLPATLALRFPNDDTKKEVAEAIGEIDKKQFQRAGDKAKAKLMGWTLVKHYSPDDLREAVRTLRDDIKRAE